MVYCNFDYDKLSLAQRQGNVSDEIGNINMIAKLCKIRSILHLAKMNSNFENANSVIATVCSRTDKSRQIITSFVSLVCWLHHRIEPCYSRVYSSGDEESTDREVDNRFVKCILDKNSCTSVCLVFAGENNIDIDGDCKV